MNLKSCPSGKYILKSLDDHLDLGRTWQPGLLAIKRPFSKVTRMASWPLRGQNASYNNQLKDTYKLGKGCFKSQSQTLKSHLSRIDWLHALAHRDN